jgi:hypothetical protein
MTEVCSNSQWEFHIWIYFSQSMRFSITRLLLENNRPMVSSVLSPTFNLVICLISWWNDLNRQFRRWSSFWNESNRRRSEKVLNERNWIIYELFHEESSGSDPSSFNSHQLLQIFHFVLHRHFQTFGSCVMSHHFKSIINRFLTHFSISPQNRMRIDVWFIQIFYFENKWNYLHELWERNNTVEWPWSVLNHGESLKNIILSEWIGKMQSFLDRSWHATLFWLMSPSRQIWLSVMNIVTQKEKIDMEEDFWMKSNEEWESHKTTRTNQEKGRQ